MGRTPMSQLSRYLLHGQLRHLACLRNRPIPHRRLFVSSAARRAETITSPATDAAVEPKRVPLIKHMRDQAKVQKLAGKRTNAERQTVPGWELSVGIEIHAQLNTRSKLFSTATQPILSDKPNTHTALFDLAIPGSQPVFQPEALIPAVRAAIALHCKVVPVSYWDRKHYFWWDQPNGYQITQFYQPFAKKGMLRLFPRDGIAEEDGESVDVRIERIQMEQDTGKTLAGPNTQQFIDFNRAGMPLIEIITDASIHHPRTAAAFVRKVQAYLRSVDACVNGMETGGLRADVNVSVRRSNEIESGKLGQRTEIKNLSSFKAVEDAIIAERDRQIAVLEQGGTVVGETRGWTIGGTETTPLRGKEGEVDYRYMPDPDLAPLTISPKLVTQVCEGMGKTTDQELYMLRQNFGLKTEDALALMDSGKIEYFYRVAKFLDAKTKKQGIWEDSYTPYVAVACNWVLHELGRLTSERNVSADGTAETLEIKPDGECIRLPAAYLADLVYFLDHKRPKRITSSVAKELLFSIFRGDLERSGYDSVEEAIDGEDLWFRPLSKSAYRDLADEILAGEEETLEKRFKPHFLEQKGFPEGQLMRFVGKMMKSADAGQVDPRTAASVLRKVIEDRYAESAQADSKSTDSDCDSEAAGP